VTSPLGPGRATQVRHRGVERVGGHLILSDDEEIDAAFAVRALLAALPSVRARCRVPSWVVPGALENDVPGSSARSP
jgi:hypothetical protein